MTFGLSGAAIATIAVGVGTSMYSASQTNKAGAAGAVAANNQAYKDYIASVNATTGNNRAIAEANTINTIRTGYKVGLLNMQTARLKEKAATEGWDVSLKTTEMLGDSAAMAAASGTIGASVDAISANIRKKSNEAQIAVDANLYDSLENQNFQLNAITTAGIDALRSPEDIRDLNGISTRSYTGTSLFAAGAMGGVAAGANLYASSQMSLGKAPTK